ncbi:MAG: tRNA pseudouridine38-40 synthase [Ignavibacteria bacterium]|nr:MAG: tRNA pseudouridine38-40 synthase [Ignavibacteria bacterium]KAF0160570.1 MAG: tRNA pseudouridine38-40 synthase [Ignavibacteria bacterium]
MNNYKLIIQYDGTNYAGWQKQNGVATVQEIINKSINRILKEEVNLLGSGRTDAGVHAWGQAANFRTEKEINLFQFQYSLNSILPNDISVRSSEKIDENFHARFDAKKRSYIYLFTKTKSPFYQKYSYHNHTVFEYDFEYLNKLSKIFLGEHDFTSLSKRNADTENKVCNVYEIHWRKGNEIAAFYITADRFLRGMVRATVGTLLEAAKGKKDESHLLDLLQKQNREEAGESLPAKGLFLFKVRY